MKLSSKQKLCLNTLYQAIRVHNKEVAGVVLVKERQTKNLYVLLNYERSSEYEFVFGKEFLKFQKSYGVEPRKFIFIPYKRGGLDKAFIDLLLQLKDYL